MKYRDLARNLRRLGWYLKRQGSKHEVWTNGRLTESVPRHQEVKEPLARQILLFASQFPGER